VVSFVKIEVHGTREIEALNELGGCGGQQGW
jgi:hypothetical protein